MQTLVPVLGSRSVDVGKLLTVSTDIPDGIIPLATD